MTARILIVDDEPAICEVVEMVLRAEGFDTRTAMNGNTALDVFHEYEPNLVLLDLNLPGIDGIQVCQRIREISGTPIVMLTARTDAQDIIAGLEAGADDYIEKPFNEKVLVARIRACMRRPVASTSPELRIGDIIVDVKAHVVTREGIPISLTPLEFDLLHTLAAHPGEVYSREALLEKVWGYRYKADTRLVNVHVQRLRSKVELDVEDPRIVVTVRGVGYRAGDPISR
ncbi:two-component system response regulator MtrA [Microbacteriaceae bacterium MWH-Ta3]|nr:two-component system response regulator MtrA [Microbacteriaceae bacterium MWH-Ta3]